jgi:hypothetical protein
MSELLLPALLVLAGLLWNEFREWMPWLARRVLNRAVAKLPQQAQARMKEELTAELAAIPGKISPLVFSCSLWWSFSKCAIFARLDAATSRYVLRAVDYVLSTLLIFFAGPAILITLALTSLSCGTTSLRRIRCSGPAGTSFKLTRFQVRNARTGQITRTGQMVLRLRLDRLPELFNVLAGEMSFVGPRPRIVRSQLVPADSHKPGIVWTSSNTEEDVAAFGSSATATMRIYFRLLWIDLRRTLFSAL